MTRNEVIERLCKLQTEVNEKVFHHETASDCFCGKGGFWDSPSYTEESYRNSGAVLEWIENAVANAIAQQLSANGASL